MTPNPATALVAAGAIALLGNSFGADKIDFGKREYDSRCAVCHGSDGKGLGPYAGVIDTRIPDVTTLSKRNGGVFPASRVYEIIDGRQAIRAHGPTDMPIWGKTYLSDAGEAYFDVPYDPELYVRTRVVALTDYLYRLQAR